MSWRKHFRIVPSQGGYNISQGSSSVDEKASAGTSSKYASYLPEVYAGHPNRIQRYYQYEDMDRDSDINAALDTIADFCTQSEEQNDEPFEIMYNDEANETEVTLIKTNLKLWIKLNDFKQRLWHIFRQTIKNGDQFFLRDPETAEWLWIDHFMVELVKVDETRGKEADEYIIRGIDLNRQAKFATRSADPSQYRTPFGTSLVPGSRPQTNPGGAGTANNVFQMSGANRDPRAQAGGHTANELSVVDADHVIHLSLSVGMDINWPFGQSILEPIFKTYKQKELLEDSIIIYRVQRAPERRIFYIDVGTMPPIRAKAHIEMIKNEIHQRRIPNRTGGGSCFALDTEIPLLDGRVLPLQTLIDEHLAGKQNWVYSCDPKTGDFAPGKITWAGVTRKNTKVIKLTLDNGEVITCTPDHKFPILGKGKIEAKDIVANVDSLVSFNTRMGNINTRNGETRDTKKQKKSLYQQVYNHSTNEWLYTHREVGRFFNNIGQKNELVFEVDDNRKTVIHHKDFNRYNNNPENLAYMNGYDHFLLHGKQSNEFWSKQSEEARASRAAKTAVLSKNQWKNLRNCDLEKYRQRIANQGAGIRNFISKNPAHKAMLVNNLTEMNKPWDNQSLKFNDRMFEIVVQMAKENMSRDAVIMELNNQAEFMALYRTLNEKTNHIVHISTDEFHRDTLLRLLKAYGFSGWKSFVAAQNGQWKRKGRKLNWSQEHISKLVDTYKKEPSQQKVIQLLSADQDFMESFRKINTKKNTSNVNFDRFTKEKLISLITNYNYTNWKDFTNKVEQYNHKVISCEMVEDLMDVGTITVDGKEEFHDFHTFALKVGVYTFNSIMDAAYNPLCLDMKTRIPLLDGRKLSITELTEEFKLGKENWVYSCDPSTGAIKPGNITWAGITRKDAKVIRVVLDNGESITMTPDHKVPVIGKGFVEAQNLTPEDSLISFETRLRNIDGRLKNERTYTQVFDHEKNSWVYSHRMVAEFFRSFEKHQEYTFLPQNKDATKDTVHHKDYDRYNNDPRNLVFMNKQDHIAYHVFNKKEFWKNITPFERQRITSKISEGLASYHASMTEEDKARFAEMRSITNKNWISAKRENDPEGFSKWRQDLGKGRSQYINNNPDVKRKLVSQIGNYQTNCPNQVFQPSQRQLQILVEAVNKIGGNRLEVIEYVSKDNRFAEAVLEANPVQNKTNNKIDYSKLTDKKLKRILSHFNYKNWKDFVSKVPMYNHRIVSIEYLEETMDVGTITIDGNERWHNHHTFATEAGIFVKNSIVEDYFFAQCLNLSTQVPVLDGRILSLKELIDEYEAGKINYVYSLDTNTHKFEVGRVSWAGITRKNAQMVRVTLDNGEYIDSTPDHRFILRDGSEVEAQYLMAGTSLMPLYLFDSKTGPNQKVSKYVRYLCNATGEKRFVHTDVCPKPKGREYVVHHKDFDSANNNPDNLEVMSWKDHEELHKSVKVAGYNSWNDFKESYKKNHKVISVELLPYREDTGDITVESDSDSHVFALAAGVYVHNSAEGRGSKVETLPGGDNLGEIGDLTFFTKKMARGLRIPSSYLSLGDDDGSGGASYNDGKLGAAVIQEFRFNKYCMRLQSLLAPIFDKDFKRFLKANGIEIESSLFELKFNPPQNFTKYRQIELDTQQVGVYQQVADNKKLSERFKLKRFLNLSEDELLENERLWAEENAAKLKKAVGSTPAESEPEGDLSSVGIRMPDAEMDMGDMEAPPEGEEGGEAPGGAQGGDTDAGGPPPPPQAGGQPPL